LLKVRKQKKDIFSGTETEIFTAGFYHSFTRPYFSDLCFWKIKQNIGTGRHDSRKGTFPV